MPYFAVAVARLISVRSEVQLLPGPFGTPIPATYYTCAGIFLLRPVLVRLPVHAFRLPEDLRAQPLPVVIRLDTRRRLERPPIHRGLSSLADSHRGVDWRTLDAATISALKRSRND